MNHSHQQKNVLSDKTMQSLQEAAAKQDVRRYVDLMERVDWHHASAAHLDRAIGVALTFADVKRAETLTHVGLTRFPEQETFKRVKRLFNPRPAQTVESKWRSSVAGLDASIAWLQAHADEYPAGQWLAVKSGQLIATGATRQEFDAAIASLGGPEILAVDTIVQKVSA